MSPPLDRVLVVIGCGPGIGVTTAALFAAHSFNKVALIARNAQRLEDYRATVLNTAKLAQREPDVRCWDVDVTQSVALTAVLIDVERMGQISCVLFNAARVGASEFFDFGEEELINDFRITNIALHITVKWAIPLLLKEGVDLPTLLVTNSTLWKQPIPSEFSLSMVKTAQRNMVQSLQKKYRDVHIAQLYIAGNVSPEDKVQSPEPVARKFLELYLQEKADWSLDMEI